MDLFYGIQRLLKDRKWKLALYLLLSQLLSVGVVLAIAFWFTKAFNKNFPTIPVIVLFAILVVVAATSIGDYLFRALISKKYALDQRSNFFRVAFGVFREFAALNPKLGETYLFSIVNAKNLHFSEFAGIGSQIGLFGEFVNELSNEEAERIFTLYLFNVSTKQTVLNRFVLVVNLPVFAVLFFLAANWTVWMIVIRLLSRKNTATEIAIGADIQNVFSLMSWWLAIGFKLNFNCKDLSKVEKIVPEKYTEFIRSYCEGRTEVLLTENKPKIVNMPFGMDEKVNSIKKKKTATIIGAFLSGVAALFALALNHIIIGLLLALLVFILLYRYGNYSLYLNKLILGNSGERRCEFAFNRLPGKYCIFTNPILDFKEFDFIVIGPTGIFVVENKNVIGNISGDMGNPFLTRVYESGKVESLKNPCKQAYAQSKILIDVLQNNNIKAYVTTCVMFSNPEAQVKISNKNGYKTYIFSDTFKLTDFIENGRSKLEDEQIGEIIRVIYNNCTNRPTGEI